VSGGRPATLRRALGLLLCLLCIGGAAHADEQALLLDGPEYPIAATLGLPESTPAPAVLLLHGTASHRDEVGNLYVRLAARLATQGIASLRIDFAGAGDSPVDHRRYTLHGAVRDAQTALAYLRAHPAIDARHLALLGFSQGGLVAQLTALETDATIAALATWSTVASDGEGAFRGFFDRHYSEARRKGAAEVRFPWRQEPLAFDLAWFEQVRAQRSLSRMPGFSGPVLAVAGLADSTVPFTQSVDLVATSAHPRSRAVLLAGADHIFNVLDDEPARAASADTLLAVTSAWLRAQLAP
jgi:alpha/beta superfamily hydrolase